MKKYKPDPGIVGAIAMIFIFSSIGFASLPSCIMSIFIDSKVYFIFKTVVIALPLMFLVFIIFGLIVNAISKFFLKTNSYIDGNEAGFWKHKINISDITEIHFFIGDINFKYRVKEKPLPYRATIVCKNKKYELIEPSFLFLLELKKKCPSLKFIAFDKKDVSILLASIFIVGIIFAVTGVFFA